MNVLCGMHKPKKIGHKTTQCELDLSPVFTRKVKRKTSNTHITTQTESSSNTLPCLQVEDVSKLLLLSFPVGGTVWTGSKGLDDTGLDVFMGALH